MEGISEQKSLSLFARRFFSGTLLSRFSGLARDLSMAAIFGDHPSAAAFIVAFRLSNLFRRLLGEGPLQSAFIPHFEGLRLQDSARATFFFRKLVLLITLMLISLTVVVEGGLIWGDSFFSENNREIVHLTRWLFPGLIFICLYGLNISLLNCYDSFFVPSVAPAVCNLIWVAAVIFLRNMDPSLAMLELAKWVVIGFIGQWLLTLPLTLRHAGASLKEWLKVEVPKEVVTLLKSFSLGALGVGAVQINAFADALFARYADVRGPAYLWYAIRLEQLALAIFGIACISAIAPRLSRAIKAGAREHAQALFTHCFQKILTVMIPATFALIFLGLPAVNLLYGHGNFSESAVVKTATCLAAYGLGLLPSTLIMLISTVYYAQANFRTPMQISILSVLLNLFLNAVFVFGLELGAVSIAIATSISAWVNCLILYVLLHREGWRASMDSLSKVIAVSAFAACVTFALNNLIFDTFPKSLAKQLACFTTLFSAFVSSFLLTAYFSVIDLPFLSRYSNGVKKEGG